MGSRLDLDGITKSFGGKPALENVSLHVAGGTTHALIGSSGSGKTTLLRITLGLLAMDHGWVKIDGRPLSDFTPAEWAAQIGYVPQEGGLFPHLTAFQNITLLARLRGWAKDKIIQRGEEMLQLAGLDPDLLGRYSHELSGGQRQRVAIMRAAFLNPPLLLLDEPMGALDPLVRMSLQQEFKKIFMKLNKTVVIVTHDLGEAAYLAERLTLLHEGRAIQTGTYADLSSRPSDPFVTQFIQAHRALPEAE